MGVNYVSKVSVHVHIGGLSVVLFVISVYLPLSLSLLKIFVNSQFKTRQASAILLRFADNSTRADLTIVAVASTVRVPIARIINGSTQEDLTIVAVVNTACVPVVVIGGLDLVVSTRGEVLNPLALALHAHAGLGGEEDVVGEYDLGAG
ncbi:hypothetical protein HAV15_003705 [Penicillium sp. str. |nr:hypothetical protein HAV15_003705 [Penicillium sp. str. \